MKTLPRILNIIIILPLLMSIGAFVVLALSGSRAPDHIPTVAGYKVLTVLSGSMEPAIHTGDLVIVRPLDLNSQIGEGGIITFRAQEKEDMLITHRVMGVVTGNGSQAAYTTKGDANDFPDLTAVKQAQVVGIYAGRLPYCGYILNFMRHPLGFILCVVLPGLLLIAAEFRTIWQILSESGAAGNSRGGGVWK